MSNLFDINQLTPSERYRMIIIHYLKGVQDARFNTLAEQLFPEPQISLVIDMLVKTGDDRQWFYAEELTGHNTTLEQLTQALDSLVDKKIVYKGTNIQNTKDIYSLHIDIENSVDTNDLI